MKHVFIYIIIFFLQYHWNTMLWTMIRLSLNTTRWSKKKMYKTFLCMYIILFMYVHICIGIYIYILCVCLENFSLFKSPFVRWFSALCVLYEKCGEKSQFWTICSRHTYVLLRIYIYTSIQWWFTYTRFRSLLVLMRSLVLSKPFVCCNNRKRTEHDRWVKRVEMATEQKTLYTYSYTKIYTHILTIHHIHITNCRFLDVFM